MPSSSPLPFRKRDQHVMFQISPEQLSWGSSGNLLQTTNQAKAPSQDNFSKEPLNVTDQSCKSNIIQSFLHNYHQPIFSTSIHTIYILIYNTYHITIQIYLQFKIYLTRHDNLQPLFTIKYIVYILT